MEEEHKTEEQLVNELAEMRQCRIAELEAADTERAEAKIKHLNLVLHAIRNVNQLITRERDRGRLPQGTCETLIATRGYHSAWIALLDESEGLVTTAEAGLGEDFLPVVEQLKRGELTDCGRRALKQPGGVATEDPSSTCADCPLSSMYDGRGAVTIRLEYGGEVYGLLSVSIPRDLAADEEERALFEEVAGDIAFALHSAKLEEERKRAEEALRRRITELATLNEIGRAINSAMKLDDLLDLTYHQTSRVMEVSAFYIALYDQEKDELHFVIDVLHGQRQLQEERSRKFGKGRTEHIICTKKPLLIRGDVEETYRHLGIVTRDERARAFAGVPVIVGGEVIGVLAVQSYDDDYAYDEDHVNLLSTIASQAAIAIKNARLFEETQQRVRELASLNKLSASIGAGMRVEELVEQILTQLAELMEVDASYFALYDEEEKEIEFVLDFVQGKCQMSDQPNRKLGKGRTDHIIRSRQPLLLRGNVREAYQRLGIETSDERARAFIGAPMILADRVIGVLGVQSYQHEDAYDEHHLELLATVAGQVAVAVERTRLLEQTQAALTEVRRLAAIVENHPDFIGGGTLDGQVLYVNPAGLKMMGLPPDYDVATMDVSDFYLAEDAQKLVEEGMPAALKEGSWSAEANLLKVDGATIPVEQTIGINYSADDKPYGFSINTRE